MDIINIETVEHQPMLKTKAKPVIFPLSEDDKELIQAMKNKLYDLGGVGLAAPQINRALQIAVVYIPEKAALLRDNASIYPMHVLINPAYTPVNETIRIDFEACYSVKTRAGKVPRYEQINLIYHDESGRRLQKIESGFYARVLQHEIDHLNGILILDRLTPDCEQGSMEEMMLLRRGQLPAEKKVIFDGVAARKLKK